MRLRRFNDAGIQRFRDELARLRGAPRTSLDITLLENPNFSEPVTPHIQLNTAVFSTKREAAEYLKASLKGVDTKQVLTDRGMWAWLSYRHFDEICPANGRDRRVLQDAHYIPDPDFRRRYRHLLMTPLRVCLDIPLHNRLFLDAPVNQHGEIMEQLASRLFVMRIPAVAEAVDTLYFNAAAGKPKRGIVPKTAQRGDLRNRFPARLRQLTLTYDIAELTGPQLLQLLGPEFDRWLH